MALLHAGMIMYEWEHFCVDDTFRITDVRTYDCTMQLTSVYVS